MPLVISTECLRDDLPLAPLRFSRLDMDRESGGVLAKTEEKRGATGVSLERAFSGLSDGGAFFRVLGSLSLSLSLSPTRSGFIREADFLGSFVGVADHAPHDALGAQRSADPRRR